MNREAGIDTHRKAEGNRIRRRNTKKEGGTEHEGERQEEGREE